MQNKKSFSESIIYTGSDMNHRTFTDDESWNSLQSTILAGHFSTDSDSESPSKKNLTTLNEENSLSKEELEFETFDGDHVLNKNLLAMSDDVFIDNQNISNSKILSDENSSFNIKTSSKRLYQVTSDKHYVAVNSPNSIHNESTADSGLEEEKTGALLVHIVEDFKDMKNHAQSTPKLTCKNKCLSPATNVSKNLTNLMNNLKSSDKTSNTCTTLKMTNVNTEMKNCNGKSTFNSPKKKAVKQPVSPCFKQCSPINTTIKEKENFIPGKYSDALNASKANSNLQSSLEEQPRKVAQIKEFFENQSKIYEQTCNRKIERKIPIKKSGLNTSQIRRPRSPSYHTQETFKLMKTSKAFKSSRNVLNSSSTTSFLLRNQTQNTIRSRPSSCSEFIAQSSANRQISKNYSISNANKSKSTNDLSESSVKYFQLLQARELKMITERPYVPLNRCMTLTPNSPGSLKVSDIMKRKSLGYVSSPVKPVKELRKIFSPARDMSVNQVKAQAIKNARRLQSISKK